MKTVREKHWAEAIRLVNVDRSGPVADDGDGDGDPTDRRGANGDRLLGILRGGGTGTGRTRVASDPLRTLGYRRKPILHRLR